MMKKCFVPGTQVIQSWLSIGGGNEPIFGAFAVASKAHVTVQAILGQFFQFIPPKLMLAIATYQILYRLILKVAQLIIGFNEVITGVQIAVMF